MACSATAIGTKGVEGVGRCAVLPLGEHSQLLLPTGSFKQAFLSLPFCPRGVSQCLQGAPHPLLNPPVKPLFSSDTKLTAVWHLDVTAIAPQAVVIAHHPGGPGCLSPSPSPTCTPGEAIPPPCSRDQPYPLHLGSTWCNRTPGSNTSSGSSNRSPSRGKSEPLLDQALNMQKMSYLNL